MHSVGLALLAVSGLFSSFAPARTAEVPRLSGEPTLDGRLDEEVWDRATLLGDFVNFRPVEGEPARHQTRVRIYRDERHLHLGIEALDPDPSQVRATFVDRDGIFQDDAVIVILDPYESGRRGFYFASNAFGIQGDCVRTEDPDDEDCSWDAVFQTGGRRTDTGFAIEMTIPFASLRFDPGRDTWAMNVMRAVSRNGEKSTWAGLSMSSGGMLEQSGRLTGMRGIPVGFTVEAIPELTTRGGPGIDTSSGAWRAGERRGPWGGGAAADLGLTAKVTRGGTALDLAANPDFSQIESDAGQIALNERFALYYDEKRPFFLEGRDVFRMPWEAVYTRTIVDPLYGVKLSGKTGGTTYAILHALDQDPAPSVVDGRWNREAYAAHDALTTVLRANSEIDPNATVGLVFADKHVGSAWNRVGGVDGTFRFLDSFRLTGQVLWSGTDHPVDPAAGTIGIPAEGAYETGTAAKVRFMRFGRHYNLFSWYEQVDDRFRAEAGFIPRAGYRQTGLEQSYRFETGRERGLVAIQPGLGASVLQATANDDADRNARPTLKFEFSNGQLVLQHHLRWERFSSEEFLQNRASLVAFAKPARWLILDATVSGGTGISYFQPADPYLGGVFQWQAGMNLRPVDRMSVGLSWRRSAFSEASAGDALQQGLSFDGERIVFDANIVRAQSQFFLTEALSTRLIGEWNDIGDLVAWSALLGYRPGPGTVMYLGWQDAAVTRESLPDPDARAVFLKLSYLFRY